jgi:hypothetical protein
LDALCTLLQLRPLEEALGMAEGRHGSKGSRASNLQRMAAALQQL